MLVPPVRIFSKYEYMGKNNNSTINKQHPKIIVRKPCCILWCEKLFIIFSKTPF